MLDNDKIKAICEQEIQAASNMGGELAAERTTALDYYMGEPYGDEKDGRSAIVTREVMETVEWIVPSLVRIFCDAENLVVFEPVGPEDEPQAEQESDVVSYVYWKQNKGFYNTITFVKDCLLSKTGVLKVWWEEPETKETEEYHNLTDQQLAQLMNDPIYEREPIEAELEEDGTLSVEFKVKQRHGRIRIEPVAPENFGVERNARTPYAKDCGFVWQRELKTYNDLVAMGVKKETIAKIPPDDDAVLEQEELARRNLTDESSNYGAATDESRRSFWVTECYIRLDANGDGVAELLKVTLASGATMTSGSVMLGDPEEVDRIPFSTTPPILLTHKFYGMSVADLTMDLQRIKSTLLRGVLDNIYVANNGRTAVNDEYVNVDDVMTSRPNGVWRFKGEIPASQVIMPIPHAPLPTETFGLMEYLDEQRKQRVGVGDEVAGLDKTSLGNVNTGVFALAYDAARMKIELIARTIAEIGLRPLFQDIHELLSKHQSQEMTMKLRNQWIPVNPGDWRTRENTTVMVGVGQVTKERRLMALDAIMAKQDAIAQAGGIGKLVMPEQMYQAYKDYTSAWGLEPDMYFQDPRKLPPPPPPQPDPQAILMDRQGQAMMIDAQAKLKTAQVKEYQIGVESQIKQAEMALRARELAVNTQLEGVKAQLAEVKTHGDMSGKVLSMASESHKRSLEDNVKRLELEMKHISEERDRQQQYYSDQLKAAVEMAKLEMQGDLKAMDMASKAPMGNEPKESGEDMAAMIADMQKKLEEAQKTKPRSFQVVRDKDGLVMEIKEA